MNNYQGIFVLRDNKISQWKYADGELKFCTQKSMPEYPYDSKEFWASWADEKYFSINDDILDALFLLDSRDCFDDLPAWLSPSAKQSNWSLEILHELIKDKLFSNVNLSVVVCGEELKLGQQQSDKKTCKLYFRPSLGLKIPPLRMFLFRDHLYIKSQDVSLTKAWNIVRNIKFQRSHLPEIIAQMKHDFVEGFNLPSDDALKFHLIENENEVLNSIVKQELGKQLFSSVTIDSVLQPVIRRLSENSLMKLNEYGVNYDGKNYVLTGGKLQKAPFSLLGYTTKDEEIVQ